MANLTHEQKLRQLKVLIKFKKNLKSIGKKVYSDYMSKHNNSSFRALIECSFTWSDTPEDLDFWLNISKQ